MCGIQVFVFMGICEFVRVGRSQRVSRQREFPIYQQANWSSKC